MWDMGLARFPFPYQSVGMDWSMFDRLAAEAMLSTGEQDTCHGEFVLAPDDSNVIVSLNPPKDCTTRVSLEEGSDNFDAFKHRDSADNNPEDYFWWTDASGTSSGIDDYGTCVDPLMFAKNEPRIGAQARKLA